uniref:RanBD1 domain-containing protein n=1 Tax=Glossina austeni TaxID=7395 RepID=A0A1A9VXD5_GLOAU
MSNAGFNFDFEKPSASKAATNFRFPQTLVGSGGVPRTFAFPDNKLTATQTLHLKKAKIKMADYSHRKPVESTEKNQLVVRADNNLGVILANLILSRHLPATGMGKNYVKLLCFPIPDCNKLTPLLLRVKAEEDAD